MIALLVAQKFIPFAGPEMRRMIAVTPTESVDLVIW